MIDSLTSKIKRYPFQTGIIVGCILCLLLVGFVNLFQDNGRTLSGNAEIIQEDYLRMAITEFGQGGDTALAGWRYSHLGSKADDTLRLMRADESIPPQLLAAFADAVGKLNVLSSSGSNSSSNNSGTPASPKKGLSGVGKALLIIILLIVLAAAALYVASLVKTRKKQKRRSETVQKINEQPVRMVTPEKKTESSPEKAKETLFDLDGLFPREEKGPAEPVSAEKKPDPKPLTPKSVVPEEKSADAEEEPILFVPKPVKEKPADEEPAQDELPSIPDVIEPAEEPEAKDAAVETEEHEPEPAGEHEAEAAEEVEEEVPLDVLIGDLIQDDNSPEVSAEDSPDEKLFEEEDTLPGENSEKDEDETDSITEEEAEKTAEEEPGQVSPLDLGSETFDIGDHIEPEIPAGTSENETVREPEHNAEKPLVETDSVNDPDSEDELLKMIRGGNTDYKAPAGELSGEDKAAEPENSDIAEAGAAVSENIPEDDETANEILIHYQSTYRIGNDMYDEVFSIDQGSIFRGECGISIGETLNNNEPKAVTAFELWLFDKDDIHTATWYLLSDFALSNEGISNRLSQHGNCERIRKGSTYILETETLRVDVTVMDLEYGSEMDEKNSYFSYVTFDVTARSKKSESDVA